MIRRSLLVLVTLTAVAAPVAVAQDPLPPPTVEVVDSLVTVADSLKAVPAPAAPEDPWGVLIMAVVAVVVSIGWSAVTRAQEKIKAQPTAVHVVLIGTLNAILGAVAIIAQQPALDFNTLTKASASQLILGLVTVVVYRRARTA